VSSFPHQAAQQLRLMPRRDVPGRASDCVFPAISRSSKFVGTGKGRDLPRSPRISGRVVHGDVSCGDRHPKPDNEQGACALIVLSTLGNSSEKIAGSVIALGNSVEKVPRRSTLLAAQARASVAMRTDDRIVSACMGRQSCHSLRNVGAISQVACQMTWQSVAT
jgi:hypothetical protein